MMPRVKCFFNQYLLQYFQITSSVYENLMMSVDLEVVESAESNLEELHKHINSIGERL